MGWLDFFRRNSNKPKAAADTQPAPTGILSSNISEQDVRRHFFNLKTQQCYASFFPYWGGWITAGHVLTSSAHNWPPFADEGKEHLWPAGLDAALRGCRLPDEAPPKPYAGQKVKVMGYPAGASSLSVRHGEVYLERSKKSGIWIAQIHRPDEPVVTGMSGGPVICKKTNKPIGIIITRNSPADLDADQIPDQSCDFIALSAVWYVLKPNHNMV